MFYKNIHEQVTKFLNVDTYRCPKGQKGIYNDQLLEIWHVRQRDLFHPFKGRVDTFHFPASVEVHTDERGMNDGSEGSRL